MRHLNERESQEKPNGCTDISLNQRMQRLPQSELNRTSSQICKRERVYNRHIGLSWRETWGEETSETETDETETETGVSTPIGHIEQPRDERLLPNRQAADHTAAGKER